MSYYGHNADNLGYDESRKLITRRHGVSALTTGTNIDIDVRHEKQYDFVGTKASQSYCAWKGWFS